MDAKKMTRQSEMQLFTETLREFLHVCRGRFETDLHGKGFTLAQLRLLKAVADQEESSAASIARKCQVTPQTMQAMLARAEREGWIVRGSSKKNQRFVTARLTTAGRAILKKGNILKARLEAELWDGVSASSIRAARETLQSGIRNLERRRAESNTMDD